MNTPGVGGDYERLVLSFFALTLYCNTKVKDFSLESNAKNHGKFDDVVIKITLENNEVQYFGFQLKHKENKHLIIHLNEYFENYKSLSDLQKKKYSFIFYSNAKVHTIPELVQIKINCDEQQFFDSSDKKNNVYKLKVNESTPINEDFKKFISHVILFGNQKNFKEISNEIIALFREKFHCSDDNASSKFIKLFTKLHQGQFNDKNIDRKTISFHLSDILLSSDLIINRQLPTEQNLELFEKAVKLFDITSIDIPISQLTDVNTSKDFTSININWHRKAQRHKIVPREEVGDLGMNIKHKIWNYFSKKILFVNCNENTKQIISCLAKYDKNIHFVLLGQLDDAVLSEDKHFKNLADVYTWDKKLYKEIISKCIVSLQGRKKISLEDIITANEEIPSVIEAEHVFYMLNSSCFLIGEETMSSENNYIDRKIAITVFDIDSLLNYAKKEDKKEIYIIIEREDAYDNIQRKIEEVGISNINVIKQDDNLQNLPIEDNTICFQNIENKFLLLRGAMEFTKKYKGKKEIVDEKDVNFFPCICPNILTAEAGMGKTTTMTYLREKCSSKFWTIKINLKVHNLFLKKEEYNYEDCFEYFTKLNENKLSDKVKDTFLKQGHVVFFFDGLDELEEESIKHVIHFLKELNRKGFGVWVSSRLRLQKRLEEQEFDTFAMEIIALNKEKQQEFVKKRLQIKYEDNQVEKFTEEILDSTKIINEDLLTPLYLYIVTQTFLDIDSEEKLSNVKASLTVLTKMYNIFFEGRYKHSEKKIKKDVPTNLSTLEDHLEKYEIAAVESLFNEDILHNLKLDLRQYQRFKRNMDPLEIIQKWDENNKAVFEHISYAEYFVCVFLFNNSEKAKLLAERLFTDQYKDLMLMLNIMMAEKKSLHLDVIHGHFPNTGQNLDTDGGGRNLLHVAVTLDDSSILNKKEILEKILDLNVSPYEKDKLFEADAFLYAVWKNSLLSIEMILQKFGMTEEAFNVLKNSTTISANLKNNLQECITHGYPNLLSALIERRYSDVVKIEDNFGNNLLHIAAQKKAQIKMVELLINFGTDPLKENKFGQTPLYIAVENDNLETSKYLIKNTNVTAEYRTELLFIAIKNKNFYLAKIILGNGCNLQKKNRLKKTLMQVAIENGQLDIFKMLCDNDNNTVDINVIDEKGETLLHYAVHVKDSKIAEYVLNSGVDMNHKNNDGRTALYLAAKYNCKDIVKLLLGRHGKDRIKIINEVKSAMEIAALKGNEDVICEVKKYIDVGIIGTTKSLLHLSCYGGNLTLVTTFLEEDQEVNMQDNKGKTPIFWAAEAGHLRVVEFLIGRGADIKVVTNEGNTLLHSAARGGNCRILQLLKENGLKINVKNKNKSTPLFMAISSRRFDATQYLIDQGADVNVFDAEGNTVISVIIRHGWPSMLKLILDNPNTKIKKNLIEDILSLAIERNQFHMLELMCDHFQKMNDVPVLVTLFKKKKIYLTKRLEVKFNLNKQKLNQLCEILIKNRRFNEINVLLQNEAKEVKSKVEQIFQLAVKHEQLPTVKLCIENKVKIDEKKTYLLVAIEEKKLNLAELLVEGGADVNFNSKDTNGTVTPLSLAVQKQDQNMVNLLIDKGAKVQDLRAMQKIIESSDFIMFSLLVTRGFQWHQENAHIFVPKAGESGHEKIIETLYKACLDINTPNENNETALFLAVKKKRFNATKQLLSYGADVNCISKDGKTVFDYLDWGNKKFVDLIFETAIKLNEDSKKTVLFCPIEHFRGKNSANLETINSFINKYNLDVNASDSKGETPLLRAVKNQQFHTAKLLISKNASVNCISKDGSTIWEYLDWHDKNLINSILHCEGIDLELENKYDQTPLSYAIFHGDINFVNSVITLEPMGVSLIQDFVLKNAVIFDILAKTPYKKTSAALVKLSERFINNNPLHNTTLKYCKMESETVRRRSLHWAVYLGDVSTIEEIVNTGIDLESIDVYNQICPLHFALRDGVLQLESLKEKAAWINETYMKKRIWGIEDMRSYLNKMFHLDFHKHWRKYPKSATQKVSISHESDAHKVRQKVSKPYLTEEDYVDFLKKTFNALFP